MNNFEKLGFIGVGVFVLLLACIILYPFGVILAINTLAPILSIPYSFSSYLAVCFLQFVVICTMWIGNIFK